MPDWRDAIRAHLASSALSPSDDAEIAEELRQHLDDRYDEYRRLGKDDADARRMALGELQANEIDGMAMAEARPIEVARPHVEPVAIGARFGVEGLRGWITDLRIGARLLRRTPGFTFIAALTLALGIGANTAIFGVVNALLLRPTPGVTRGDELVLIGRTQRGEGFDTFAYPDYLDYRRTSKTLSGVAAHYTAPVHLSSSGGDSERMVADLVSGNFFRVLGMSPALGRFFLPDEVEAPGADAVIVLGHDLWQRRFGGAASVIGQTVHINAHAFTVIGVAPRGFAGIERGPVLDLFVPLPLIARIEAGRDALLTDRAAGWLSLFGRREAGTPLSVVASELSAIAGILSEQFPASNAERSAAVADGIGFSPESRGEVRAFTSLLLAVVALVLLIACANVANLLLARASVRQREFSIRASLGASRARLVRQLLAEGLVLSLLGGLGGLIAGAWTSTLILRLPFFTSGNVQLDVSPDLRVVLFTAGVSIVSTLAFGLPAAFRASRVEIAETLKSGSAGAGDRRALRNSLLVGQLALSMVLLVAAGLFTRTVRALHAIDPGFAANRVLLATVDVALQGYDEPRGREFYAEFERRASSLPGVGSASLAYMLPLGGGGWDSQVYPSDRVADAADEGLKTDINSVTPSYFASTGMRLTHGRTFSSQDRSGAPRVAIVNEAFASAMWPGADAVGKRYRVGREGEPVEVVGVVQTAKYRSLLEAPRPFMYYPFAQSYHSPMTLHLTTTGDPATLAPRLREITRELDADLPAYRIQTLASRRDASIGPQRTAAILIAIYGGLALLVAAVGLYGTMAYAVTRRTREIGIRMALGARASRVLRDVLAEAGRIALIGLALGAVIAIPAARLLRSQLFGISPADPLTFVLVAAGLLGVALLAAVLPARRATRVDPVTALRAE